jgi:hypothetical protein
MTHGQYSFLRDSGYGVVVIVVHGENKEEKWEIFE